MTESADQFAQLLTLAIRRTSYHESKKISVVQEELGYALGRKGGSVIEHWRKGHLPPRASDVETLARELVRRHGLENHEQLEQFLRSVGEPILTRLCDELFPFSVEIGKTSVRRNRNVPPLDDKHLFGIGPLVADVTRRLSDPDGPALVVLDGMGGLGKTTVAQAVASRLAASDSFADILWISAKQTQLLPNGEIRALSSPALTLDELFTGLAAQLGREDLSARGPQDREAALQTILSAAPYLIVIDNLETMDDYSTLIPRLQSMAGATRFLITSRHSLRRYPFVHTCPIPSLSRTDSLALLRHELERQGRDGASAEALDAVCQAVGGLPLALKLIAAQLGRLPLDYILHGLRTARGQTAEALYTFIYRHTWMLLDDLARQLLTDMLLVSPDGEDVEWLRLMSDLSSEQLEQALAQLMDFSLVEVSGPLERPLYRMHRLTMTFLQTDILDQWEGNA